MLEDKINKHIHTSIGWSLKSKEIPRDENDKQVHTSTGESLKKKYMFRYKKGKQVRTYSDVLSTVKLSN